MADRFQISYKSIFDTKVDAYVNTINCVGAMGAGIALEFKNRYPRMFQHYKEQCSKNLIRPGDCYIWHTEDTNDSHYVLGLAVKNDWRHWSTLEWLESSIKSLKLVILENDIKSVNLPLPGGKNGRKGPYGKVLEPKGLTPLPDRESLKLLVKNQLHPFANKFGVDINLCIPDEKVMKRELTLDSFM
jgi:hypothetical protein